MTAINLDPRWGRIASHASWCGPLELKLHIRTLFTKPAPAPSSHIRVLQPWWVRFGCGISFASVLSSARSSPLFNTHSHSLTYTWCVQNETQPNIYSPGGPTVGVGCILSVFVDPRVHYTSAAIFNRPSHWEVPKIRMHRRVGRSTIPKSP